MLIDTHCHINTMIKENFDVPLNQEEIILASKIISEANENLVKIILNVGTSLIESNNSIELAKKYDSIFATVGIHPTDVNPNFKQEIKLIESLIKNKTENKILGIGECGIDLYHKQNLTEQEHAFEKQIELALEYDLALVIHSRNAPDETLNIVSKYKKNNIRGVIHCFSYDMSIANEFIDIGFVLGIGGTITYPKNTNLRNVVKMVKMEHIILETDAPFLPPQIIRGKQNHPKYIKFIAEYIAEIKNLSFEEVAEKTTERALQIFRVLPS